MAPGLVAGLPAVRGHLRELLESPAFKGSRRGQQFLECIVEKALSGQGEELKERSLGVELFGRDPAYDTGEDAIVRVTASDVRKRLHQYYSTTDSAVRIEIPSGAYAPQFHVVPRQAEAQPEPPPPRGLGGWWRRAALSCALLVVVAAPAAWFWQQSRVRDAASPLHVLPWSALLQSGRQLQIVLSDPDLSALQELTGSPMSLSDYANRRYLTPPGNLGRDKLAAYRLLVGVNVAAVDAGIAVDISRLAAASPARVKTHTARSLQLSAFKSDDEFIILGSPRSNPWGELFEDQMDFDFVFDAGWRSEVIRNKRPKSGELPRYQPTARGWGTGYSFSTIALVGNPNQSGRVLILAGTNAEGTEAAGQFVTNAAELAATLRAHGIDPADPACRFQILLQVRTMAGSPSRSEVVACHRLTGAASK